MLSIGLLFAGLNIVLIVVNYRTMLRNLYARLMLLVQCCYVVLIVIDAQPPIEDLTACRFAAACFYVFWMVTLFLLSVVLDVLCSYCSSSVWISNTTASSSGSSTLNC